MDYNFPEALDAVIEDNAIIRRKKFVRDRDKYIYNEDSFLMFINGTPYIPTNEDLFADDWQIFGKGVLGSGHVKKENKQYDRRKRC